MLSLSLFGKGGVGKSTIACNLSAVLARRGLRVAQIGCDPKADSVSRLVGGRRVPRIVDYLLQDPRAATGDAPLSPVVVEGLWGTSCLESGGPEPGIGCAGRGVDLALQFLRRQGFFQRELDVVLLDVLGDVVCGGFASPLRRGFGQSVCIVTSEETLPLYAANNIARMVANHAPDGARLIGLVVNSRDANPPRERLLQFAERLGTRVLSFFPADPLLRAASDRYRTVVEERPDAPISLLFEELGQRLTDATDPPVAPTPMSDEEFLDFLGERAPGARVAAPAAGVAGDPAEEPAWFEGGPGARAELARVFKLPPVDDERASARYTSVRQVRWLGQQRVEVDLGAPTGEQIHLALEQPGGDAFLTTEHWALSHSLEGVRPGQRRLIASWLTRLARRLEGMTLPQVVGLLDRDPGSRPLPCEAPAETAGVVTDEAGEEHPDEPYTAPLGRLPGQTPDDWRRHLCTDRLEDLHAREVQLDFGLSRWDPMIRFGDLECQKPSASRHLSWPMDDRLLVAAERRAARHAPDLRRGLVDDVRFADLDQADVVMGCRHKLESLGASAEGSGATVRFESCCVPMVTGVNVDDTLQTLRDTTGATIHHHLPAQQHTRLIHTLERALADGLPEAPEPGTYNLIGFPESARTRELAALLEQAGCDLHQTVIPGPFSGEPDRFSVAERFVFAPNACYQAYYEPLLGLTAPRAVTPAAPYGVSVTRRWLAEVAGELGQAQAVDAVWERALAAVEEHWQGLRARAAAQRLVLVVEATDLAALLEPRLLGGLDLLGFLQEAGFPVDVVAPPADDASAPMLARLAARLQRGDVIQAADEHRWLEAAAGGRYGAMLSNLIMDDRHQRLGLGRFSLFDIEIGLRGALASAERILHACSMSFYRKYREYLSP